MRVFAGQALGNWSAILLALHQIWTTGLCRWLWGEVAACMTSPDSLHSTAHVHTQHLASGYRWWHCSNDLYIPGEWKKIHLTRSYREMSHRTQVGIWMVCDRTRGPGSWPEIRLKGHFICKTAKRLLSSMDWLVLCIPGRSQLHWVPFMKGKGARGGGLAADRKPFWSVACWGSKRSLHAGLTTVNSRRILGSLSSYPFRKIYIDLCTPYSSKMNPFDRARGIS
jgi:hypothetical protein